MKGKLPAIFFLLFFIARAKKGKENFYTFIYQKSTFFGKINLGNWGGIKWLWRIFLKLIWTRNLPHYKTE
jgi:hypothetical protein